LNHHHAHTHADWAEDEAINSKTIIENVDEHFCSKDKARLTIRQSRFMAK